MATVRSAHARLAALIRHYGDDAAIVNIARQELAQAHAESRTIRSSIVNLSATERQRILDILGTDREGSAA